MKDYPLYNVPECRSFAEFLSYVEERYSDLTAFRTQESAYSYHDFVKYIHRLMPLFGNSSADAFALPFDNPLIFASSLFATILVGKIAVLCDIESANRLDCGLRIEELSEAKLIDIFASEEILAPMGSCSIAENDGAALIALSSGTTGYAKGVQLSQENILSDMVACMRYTEYKQGGVFFHIVPYSHLFGTVGDLLIPLYSGSTICYSDAKLSFFENLSHFKPTVMNLPPALVSAMCKLIHVTGSVDQATGGCLEKIICGGSKEDTGDCEYLRKLGIKVITAYGLTECSPCISLNRDEHFKPGSGGKVLPCCKVKIVDGEIYVSGTNVMLGYASDEEATAAVVKDGWLRTGDLGDIDDDGFLYITGRRTNLIVFDDGTKIMIDEVEELLCLLDGVEECIVREACVNNRVRFNIEFVCSPATESVGIIKQRIIAAIKERGLLSKLSNLSPVDGPLPKNALGKLIRLS